MLFKTFSYLLSRLFFLDFSSSSFLSCICFLDFPFSSFLSRLFFLVFSFSYLISQIIFLVFPFSTKFFLVFSLSNLNSRMDFLEVAFPAYTVCLDFASLNLLSWIYFLQLDISTLPSGNCCIQITTVFTKYLFEKERRDTEGERKENGR